MPFRHSRKFTVHYVAGIWVRCTTSISDAQSAARPFLFQLREREDVYNACALRTNSSLEGQERLA
jgi:hypothetical protein